MECSKCPAFLDAPESIATGLCHGCRSGPPEMVVDTPHGPLHSPIPDENDVSTLLRQIAGQIEDEREVVRETVEEVESVLRQLDNLASVWGDEGVFRACRDRLRVAVKKAKSEECTQ